MSIWKGIQLYNCSLEFSLHAIAALNATHAMLVFGEHCCEEEARRNEEDDTAEMIGVSSSSCLRPQRNATERLVDGAELFDGLFSTSANLTPLQYDIPPYAVLAHDANRRLFTLLKYSHVWASNIIANIGVGSFIGTPLSWCEHNVDKLRAKWQLAVFLGVPACVFPPLPTRKQQDGSDDSILTLRRIAEFLLGCVAGAASASSREAQCWVPCTLRDGHDTAGYIRWREFCSCLPLSLSAQCSVAKAVGSHTTPLATENILLRNIVSRGAIPFAAPTALCELDIAHSFTATLSQLETNWTRVGAVNGDTEQQSTDNNNISVANAAAQRRDRHKFRALEDKLQVPLQPLGDHLDGGVYQTFEQDRPKYLQYYRAVRAYLEDCKLEEEAGVNNTNGDADHLVTVLVLGAGRGPLVSECLIAATDADVRVHVIALEKNPAAVQFLRCKHQLDPAWKHLEDFCGHQVSIVHGDGRTLASTVMMNSATQYLLMFASVSCVVSELLGSAGDNELSPECIDGTVVELGKIRNAADAIDLRRLNRPITSIPANVTFFATPVQSATLAHQIRSRRDCNGGHPPSALSTIYVSHMTRAVMLDEPQAVWSFEHPPATATTTARDADTTFSSHRRAVVQFSIPPRGRVDVLGGYFTSLLYKSAGGVEHMLSTVPARWDPVGMYSWFPCVFPVLGGQPTCSDSLLHMQRDLVADESLSTTLRVEFLRGVRDTSETDLSSSSKSSVSSHGVFTSWRAKLLPPTGSRNAADVVLDDGAWGWHNDNGSAAVVRL
ncbi:arginine N-methyltransferase, type II, putative [Bodo saltans]|uniref:Arginine N-methyltransferase, type II, putative n=1 Tax=Bodo saltans TaxID=75058 RepID=A0A0S4IZK4_BODSA|nr:arginine N-methyltransferase, type II, putative [Bodo saltans]|eukprot:CUG33776.1 arginine N-methyltransferase, type II, putative [Bodo saltans]